MQGFTAPHGMHRLRCVTKVSRQGFPQDRLRRCKSFVFSSPKKGNHHEVTGGFTGQEIVSVKIESAGWLLQLWRHRIFLLETPTLLKKENKRPAPPTFSDKVGSNKPPLPPISAFCMLKTFFCLIERFSFEYRKTKTKVITLANHKRTQTIQ